MTWREAAEALAEAANAVDATPDPSLAELKLVARLRSSAQRARLMTEQPENPGKLWGKLEPL